MSKPDPCPRCGAPLERDEVDIGVGVQYGPAGCPGCFWVEGETVGPKLPVNLLRWAGVVVRNHGSATDAHVVLPEVVNAGVVVSPAVTLGELREWIETPQKLGELCQRLDQAVATWEKLKELSAGKTIISAAEPVVGRPAWTLTPKLTLDEIQEAIVDGVKLHLSQDGTVVVFSLEEAHALADKRADKVRIEAARLAEAKLLRDYPLEVRQLAPFTRIPLDALDMCTDLVTFDVKTGKVLSRVSWASCLECRQDITAHDPKCSRYEPKAEE